MATADDLIIAAFRKSRIGNSTVADRTDALEDLNNLLSSLGPKFLNVPVSESFTLTIGTAEYTIGDGGDFNTVRPLAIKNIFLRNSDDYDYRVRPISNLDYVRIDDKAVEGRPYEYSFIQEYPLAKVIFNREPDEAYTAYFKFIKNFVELDSLNTTVILPDEYKEFLVYKLAVTIAENRGIELARSAHARGQELELNISRLVHSDMPPEAEFDFYVGYYESG